MIRFRTWLCAATAAFGLTLGYGAQAQTNITIKLPSGSSCSFNGSTLDCSGGSSGAASCSISGKSSAVTGDTVTLTGSCVTATGAADTMTWGGCGQASGSTCTLTSSATITLTGGAGGSASKTVSFGAASCSISPNGAIVQSGTSQTFSANCNFTPTSYSWTGACTGSSATCTVSPTVAGTVNLTASNGASSASASTDFSISTGGSSGIPSKCTDGKGSVTGPTINDFSGRAQTVKMSNSQVAVIPIVVPQGVSKFTVQLTEYGDATDRTPRNVWLSKNACSVSSTAYPSFGQSYAEGMIGSNLKGAASWNFSIGSSSSIFYDPLLGQILPSVRAGETWYMMVEWVSGRSGGCTATSCQLQYTASSLN